MFPSKQPARSATLFLAPSGTAHTAKVAPATFARQDRNPGVRGKSPSFLSGKKPRRGKLFAFIFALLPALYSAAISAEINFPQLTGRVVDNADMLDPETEQVLTEQLAAHEQATGNQIVVVTLPDLQGYSIEDYGYQLGRHWQLGQKDKNNGALLIVAKKERKVRIEVGYGLEGQLTDAVTSSIVHMVILPRFRKNDFNGGIAVGVTRMIEALGGEYAAPEQKDNDQPSPALLGLLVLFVFVWILVAALGGMGGGRRGRGGYGGYYGGGFGHGGGFGGGGGFSGGGGSFGGGGASGGW